MCGICGFVSTRNTDINNLKYMNKSKNWLIHELKIRGYNDLSNVFLVTLDINEKVTIYEKNKDLDSFDILE